MSKFNIKKTCFILSIAIAIYFSLLAIGKKVILPFPNYAKFDALVTVDISDKKPSLISDKQGSRLIFLNNEHNVKNIIEFSNDNTLSKATFIARDNNYFYVSGVKLERNSIYVEYERILRYTLDGKKSTIIYEEKKDTKDDKTLIKDIFVNNNYLYITKFNTAKTYEDTITKVLKINLSKDKDFSSELLCEYNTPYAFSSKYSLEDNSIYSTDYFGRLSKINDDRSEYIDITNDHIVFPFLYQNNDLYWFDANEKTLNINEQLISKNNFTTFLNICDDNLIYDNQNDSTINLYNINNFNQEVIKTAKYSIPFFCFLLMKLLSVLYLFIVILILFIKTIIARYKEKNYKYLKHVGIIALSISVIVFISIFYTRRQIESNINIFKNQMYVLGDFFANTMSSDELDSITSENVTRLYEYDKYYNTFVDLEAQYNQYIYLVLLKKQNDKYRVLYDSSKIMQYGLSFNDDVFLNNNYDTEVNLLSIYNIKAYFYSSYIKNKLNDNIGAIGLGFDYNAFHEREFTICFEMIMTLLTIFVAIYILITEVIAFLSGLRKRKTHILQNKKNIELDLMHSIAFTNHIISSFDTLIFVLISKDIVSTLNVPNDIKNTLIIIPSVMIGIGSIIAPILYVRIAKVLDVRKNLVGSGILWSIFFVLLAFAILANNYILFCLFTLLKSIFDSYIYTGISSMLFKTSDEEERYIVLNENSMGKISATICGTLLGGLVVNYFGNFLLYIIIALSCIPMIIIFLVALPKNEFYIKKGEQSKVKATTIKYLFSIPTLSFILFVLSPIILSNGYKNYLFPLFIDSMDMPKMYITNFYVFARVLTIVLIDPIVKTTKKMDYWILMVVSIVLIGLSFISFGINSTAMWAIIMLSINLILDKISEPTKAMLWPRQARAFNLNVIETQSIMALFERALLALKEVVFAYLLLFGASNGCMIFGIICIVCAMLFYFLSKNSAMAKIHLPSQKDATKKAASSDRYKA